ncbi:MAG: glycosyltransferase [Crocinitomicaceae bacterium]|nr:glycosyltransferase [Crocinitomicaceae bacterium]
MKILLECKLNQSPARKIIATGRAITSFPSGSIGNQFDLLAKGLVEKGHQVYYLIKDLEEGYNENGVQIVHDFIDDIDLVHIQSTNYSDTVAYYQSKNIPAIATNHGYVGEVDRQCKWVYVSKSLAQLYNEELFIWNGINPDDFIFSEQKEDYILFLANITNPLDKGLDIALEVCKKKNLKLIVAGSSKHKQSVDRIITECEKYDVEYLGDVRGVQKAELIAHARALISPSRLPESFGLTLIEAMISGTPVICSDSGAHSEIVPKEVGFVCNRESEYIHAIENIHTINSKACKAYAIENYHYHKTTEKYIELYKDLIASKKTNYVRRKEQISS